MADAILDTNILVGLLVRDDRQHPEARRVMSALPQDATLLYLDVVMMEAIGVLQRKTEKKLQGRPKQDLAVAMDRQLNGLETQVPTGTIVRTMAECERRYDDIVTMVRHEGVLNFVDAWIAIWAQTHQVLSIVSLDQDFDQVSWLTRIK
ncbi:MAG: type II toxin-antitoxin system VapC family toxin [Nitrospirae bacterium]|nr:type II toxin-antitoxin system VapC family toxin [Nitrospirota bacterium]